VRPVRQSNLIEQGISLPLLEMRERGGLAMPNAYQVNFLSLHNPLQTKPTAFIYLEHAKSPTDGEIGS